jgi:hypothetical protein
VGLGQIDGIEGVGISLNTLVQVSDLSMVEANEVVNSARKLRVINCIVGGAQNLYNC